MLVVLQQIAEFVLCYRQRIKLLGKTEDQAIEKEQQTALSHWDGWKKLKAGPQDGHKMENTYITHDVLKMPVSPTL